MSNTYTYNFTAGGYTGTLTVTTSSTSIFLAGAGAGYAVTNIAGSFDGQTIKQEYGNGGAYSTIPTSIYGDANGDGYDNTIFTTSSSGYGHLSHRGIDMYGLAFTTSDGDTFSLSYHNGAFSFNSHLYSGQPVTLNSTDAPCYASGTRILTPHGEVAVEALRTDDFVVTNAGETKPIKWIGHRHTHCRRHPDRVWPVRIQAGAFGPAMPKRDLYLSPDHAVFAEGVLIPVKYLINGTTIVQEPRKRVSYYHVELDDHDVILAEGLPCESYLDNGTRTGFDNGGSVVQINPNFSPSDDHSWFMWEAFGFAPLMMAGEEVERVRARLRERAASLSGACLAKTRLDAAA